MSILLGPIGLVIRYLLYAAFAALSGAGIAVVSQDGAVACLDAVHLSGLSVDWMTAMLTGGAGFGLTALWSRIAKEKGGAT